ncbi:MAG TPA: c-type cytochrome domain-containing protein [Bacteroidales bacterium]|nr:c-type cytochrome domain-containing protein [Bacteroidales bacterium]
MRIPLSIFLLVVVAAFFSCKHKAEITSNTKPNDTITPPPPDTGVKCSPDTVYFYNDILPLINSNCAKSGCHDEASHQGDLTLTTYQGIMNGGVEPFHPESSDLYQKIITGNPDDRMPPPPDNPLTSAQAELVYKWILQGALNNKCNSTVCDTSNVTYSGTINPILQQSCVGCHSGTAPSGGIDLSTYNGVYAVATNGYLLSAVNWVPGFSPMPKNGNKLPACELTQIRIWVNAGAPNN